MNCRRCSECANSDHHWLENGDFGNDPDDSGDPTGNEYICKHCPAVGDECPDCYGEGEVEDDYSVGQTCARCGGEGIILSTPKAFEDCYETA
jgi:DnaJ-class molecular chaperone